MKSSNHETSKRGDEDGGRGVAHNPLKEGAPEPQSSPEDIRAMFDRIAHRYDFLNRLLSFGQSDVWRRRMARYLRDDRPIRLLDLATGTGDQLLALARKRYNMIGGVGLDLSNNMLEIGRAKIARKGLENIFQMQKGDATEIPFGDESFDAATITFGIRNVRDVDRALSEMHRVLKTGGRALILEFSIPRNRIIRKLYLFYFRTMLPRIGGLISGDKNAYGYLNQTVESFPYGEEFCALMRKAGFVRVAAHPMTFGVATVYVGDK